MRSEKGTSSTPTAAAEPQAGCSSRLLPTSPSNSSPNSSSNPSLQPPPLPYVPDACFDIKPHKPPPPYDGGAWYDKPDPKEWNGNPWPWGEGSPDTIIEQYLAVPPRKTDSHPDQVARRLQITHQIRCGDPCMAQVVRCCVDGRDLVAKIFDPLYVGLDEDGHPPTYFSERFYSCEAAAYERIKECGLDGRFTPKFEGCWFFKLPLRDAKGNTVHREVRLILQQFIPGDTMEALIERGEVARIDPKVRMDLLARLMEIFSKLDFIGVRTEDKHPRNIMLVKDAKNRWDITLIDFSHSRVRDLPNSKWFTLPGRDLQLPESPITILGGSWPPHCSGWIPKEYDGRNKDSCERSLKWMRDRWEGSGQYGPVNYRWLLRSIEDDSTEDGSTDESNEDSS